MPTIGHNPQHDTAINRSIFRRANSPSDDALKNNNTDDAVTRSFICCCGLGVNDHLDTSLRGVTRTSVILGLLLFLFLTYTGVAAGVSVFVIMATRQAIVIGAFMISIWILWLLCTLGIGYLIFACTHTLVRQLMLRARSKEQLMTSGMKHSIDSTMVIPPPPEIQPSPLTPSRPIPYHSMMRRWNMQSLDITYEYAEKHLEMMNADRTLGDDLNTLDQPILHSDYSPAMLTPMYNMGTASSGADGNELTIAIPQLPPLPRTPKTPTRSPQTIGYIQSIELRDIPTQQP
jgi:hypothetical protein